MLKDFLNNTYNYSKNINKLIDVHNELLDLLNTINQKKLTEFYNSFGKRSINRIKKTPLLANNKKKILHLFFVNQFLKDFFLVLNFVFKVRTIFNLFLSNKYLFIYKN